MDVFFVSVYWRLVSYAIFILILDEFEIPKLWNFHPKFTMIVSSCKCCSYKIFALIIYNFLFILSGGTMLNQLSQCANIYLANTSYAGCSIQLSVRNILSQSLSCLPSSSSLMSSYMLNVDMLNFQQMKFSSIFLSAEYRGWRDSDFTANGRRLLHRLLSICAMYKENQRKCAGKYWRLPVSFMRLL